jgi:hypothetical protein
MKPGTNVPMKKASSNLIDSQLDSQLRDAVAEAWLQSWNSKEWERPPLEAVTRRLMTVTEGTV